MKYNKKLMINGKEKCGSTMRMKVKGKERQDRTRTRIRI